jgi:hypothetical protein
MRKKVLAKAGKKTLEGGGEGGKLVSSGGEQAVAGKVKGNEIESRFGRTPKSLSEDMRKKACHAARLGIPEERIAILCGFHGNAGGWQRLLQRNPSFAAELQRIRVEGEVGLIDTVGQASDGWQGSAWILERTRGYTVKAQLEHSGPGGKSLTIAHQVLAVVNPAERA